MFIAHVVWHFASLSLSHSLLLRCDRPKKIYNLNHLASIKPFRTNQIQYTHFGYLINIYRFISVCFFSCSWICYLFFFFFSFTSSHSSSSFVHILRWYFFGWTNIAVSMLHSNYDNSTPFIRLCAHAPSLGTLLFFFPLRLYTMRDWLSVSCRRVCRRATVCVFANHVFLISLPCCCCCVYFFSLQTLLFIHWESVPNTISFRIFFFISRMIQVVCMSLSLCKCKLNRLFKYIHVQLPINFTPVVASSSFALFGCCLIWPFRIYAQMQVEKKVVFLAPISLLLFSISLALFRFGHFAWLLI